LVAKLLSPLGHGVAMLARWRYQRAIAGRTAIVWPAAPVIVVGNISVGGTGKTPLTIWLVERARALGYHPGVVLRGYGGRDNGPTAVAADSRPGQVGDEAVLIARRTRAPVWVGKDRPAAAEGLLGDGRVNMIFSDDGLQHYRLGRDVELAVVDARRGYGNQRCLPAGPLRGWQRWIWYWPTAVGWMAQPADLTSSRPCFCRWTAMMTDQCHAPVKRSTHWPASAIRHGFSASSRPWGLSYGVIHCLTTMTSRPPIFSPWGTIRSS
jgi:hypothetical protein